MSRLREAYLPEEIAFGELRRRLSKRGVSQTDFVIPAGLAALAEQGDDGEEFPAEPWGRACAQLRKINHARTASAQLGYLLQAAGEVYATVLRNQLPPPAKQWTIGADEFKPVFLWICVKCGATDLRSCLTFMEECAPPTMTSGEGGYYLMELRTCLMLLAQLNDCYPWLPGPLPIGDQPPTVSDTPGGAAPRPRPGRGALPPQQDEEDTWIWSYADDSDVAHGYRQDKWVPYSPAFSQKLEAAVAAGSPTEVPVENYETRNHVDLKQVAHYSEAQPWNSPIWQVVTKDPSRRRLVKRERSEMAIRRRTQQQAQANARQQRQQVEVSRRKAEQALLGDDTEPPMGAPLAFPPKTNVWKYSAFSRRRMGGNHHQVQHFALTQRADSGTRYISIYTYLAHSVGSGRPRRSWRAGR